MAPPLAPGSLASSFAPYIHLLKFSTKQLWGQPSQVVSPTVGETPVLGLEQRATLGIKDLQMPAIVTVIMNGTQSCPFKMSLSKNLSNTIHELLKRWDKYVDADEAYFITKGMKYGKEPKSNKRKTWDKLEPRDDKGKQVENKSSKAYK
ncbi:Uncharacterized protein Adt_30806 [Abeliophyllum distichum]|uniref:Uncharacterized protein n=1 Tax=Abeliophyllum distichum TaxID=126358 RepID=A0ABD1RCB8_9LAMI